MDLTNGGNNNGIQKGDNNSGRPNNNPAKCQQIFESRMLKLHNDLRSMHQVSPLRFDKKLKIAAESLTKRYLNFFHISRKFLRKLFSPLFLVWYCLKPCQ